MIKTVQIQRFSYRLRRFPLLAKMITYFIRIVFGCYLPYQLKIGKKFVLGYGGIGIVIHERVIIGEDVHVGQNVTIGGTTKKYEVPKIGNYVYIGAGAVVLGPITIGDNVVIGANSVVVKDIPSGSLVVGVPAKIIKSNIKKSDYV
jgi:serine O-acetyltransferase